MRNLIYQYWSGKPPIAVKAGKSNMKAYADRIGAEYLYKRNPTFANNKCDSPQYYNAFEPIYNEEFHQYDNVLFADLDVFTVDNLNENIFNQDVGDIGVCDEPHKEISHLTTEGHINTRNDEKWNSLVSKTYGKEMPRNKDGNLKIFNSGVVLYSNKGLKKAQEIFEPFQEYIDLIRSNGLNRFYSIDQNYLHAMMVNLDYTIMHNGWNSYVHYDGESKTTPRAVIDTRTNETKMVHVQLRGADNHDEKWHYDIVNKPTNEWNL